MNIVTSSLVAIITETGAYYADDLESLTHPIKDVISFIWSTPMDESFHENLYFLFDNILDIVYCIYDILDEVWHGSTYIIESKLSQISLHILRIVDEMKMLSESDGTIDYHTNLRNVNETIVELTISLVDLTSITTSIAQMITTRDRMVSLIVGTIASLIIIHQYAVSAVACILSRAVKIINSLDVMHAAGLAIIEATIVKFVTSLQPVVMHNFKEGTMTQLFHGDLHSKLSMHLLNSVSGSMMDNKMLSIIHATAISLLNFIQEYVPIEFHVLPDLLHQLTVILLQCGRTAFLKLEQIITYAFDGLYDVLHHISYKLDRHIQSSASTGSFQEPSQPIDMALEKVSILVKLFIHDSKRKIQSDPLHLIASTGDLMTALLDPMNIVINQTENDFSIALVSSLQFIALYAIGLVATPLKAAMTSLQNVNAHSEIYSNFIAALSLAFIKIQMIFDYSHMQSTLELLNRLYDAFDDLLQDLTRLVDEGSS